MRCLLRALREPEITMAAAALPLLLLLLLLRRCWRCCCCCCCYCVVPSAIKAAVDFSARLRALLTHSLTLSLALTHPALYLTGNPPCCAPSPRTTMGCVTLLLPWFSIITVVMFALHLRARQATSDGHKGLNSRRQLRKNALIKVFNLFLITICTHFSA